MIGPGVCGLAFLLGAVGHPHLMFFFAHADADPVREGKRDAPLGSAMRGRSIAGV